MLGDVRKWLSSYVAFPSAHAETAVTLWVAHTHMADAFESTPRLALLSPERECGKTRTLELLALTCAGAELLNDASPAFIFRRIGSGDAGPCTLLLDEADLIWRRGKADEAAEALRSILNSGHRKGASVGRVEMNGQGARLVRFPVYCPAAIAAIGSLPDTLLSRSIVIRMRRRAPSQRVAAYRERITGPEGVRLRGQLAAWADAVKGRVGDPWPVLPDVATDRRADAWEPLISVADLAGGPWPRLARDACAGLIAGAGDDDAQTAGTRLLVDLREVFAGRDVMFTDSVLRALRGRDEAPWGDWYGRPLSARDLAKLLRGYGVRSRQVRVGDVTAKGYRREDLADAWSRYVPAQESETAETSETCLASDVSLVSAVSHTPPDDAGELPFTAPDDDPGEQQEPCTRCGRRVNPPGRRRFCDDCIKEVTEENARLAATLRTRKAQQEAELERVRTWEWDRLIMPPGKSRRQRQVITAERHPTGWISNLGCEEQQVCQSIFDLGADAYHEFHGENNEAHPVIWRVTNRVSRSAAFRTYYCDAHLPDEFRPPGQPDGQGHETSPAQDAGGSPADDPGPPGRGR